MGKRTVSQCPQKGFFVPEDVGDLPFQVFEHKEGLILPYGENGVNYTVSAVYLIFGARASACVSHGGPPRSTVGEVAQSSFSAYTKVMDIRRNPTRSVKVGSISIGGGAPVVVQSMCATRTQDIDATVEQTESLRKAGAGIVRIAVDSDKDAEALQEIRKQTTATLSVDLQENYRLAAKIASSPTIITSVRMRRGGSLCTVDR